jgi:predicted GNAT family acetyltransferase
VFGGSKEPVNCRDEVGVVEVVDNSSERRYEALLDGQVVGVIDYSLDGNVITLQHTIVPNQYEGQGIASSLASFALSDSRDRGRHVVPQCPFVASYITRHPETLDVIVEGWRTHS